VNTKPDAQRPVAVIGMSCYFPRASGLKSYWRLLFRGEDAITEVPPSHWSREEYFDPDPKAADRVYCTRGGFLDAIPFDPSEFGIPPAALEATDSSQLLALVAAKAALADAGRTADPARTSVILGVTGTQELVIPLGARLGHPRWRRALEAAGVDAETSRKVLAGIAASYVDWQESSFPGLLGNVVAGRICNRLNLGGTNCVVDAACASSLAAVHLALLELESGRSDLVVTGGVDTLNDIFMHMCFAKTRTLSPTGDARPFSARADGTVLGEGVGLVVLKRLEDAERDGNRIYAVIRGIGSSSDGRSQSIYAPRAEGQLEALRAAYAAAGIDPASVALIEAHGTGTRVGDKVEFEALCRLREAAGGNGRRCALGSVKSNIGHTKAAAGAAGLIKAALALHWKVLPPTLKADPPDPALGIDDSPFFLPAAPRPWFTAEGLPRRAGVSAFGFGGSNFHLVLEEHGPRKSAVAWDGSVELLAFSSDDPGALRAALARFRRGVESPEAAAWIAAEAARGRAAFSAAHAHRLLIVLTSSGGAAAALDRALARLAHPPGDPNPPDDDIFYGHAGAARGRLAFLFPGQGSQYPDMGRDLVCLFPQAMAAIEAADRRLPAAIAPGPRIFPLPGVSAAEAESALRETRIAQPALAAASLAMLATLRHFGIRPDAAAGHSFGELTALCAAGWMPAESLFDLAAARGAAMTPAAGADPGCMLAVRAPLAEIEAVLAEAGADVVLANRNSPIQGVLSGPAEAIAGVAELLRRKRIAAKPIPVAGAFHSPCMRAALPPFLNQLTALPLAPADIPVYSNTTGGPYPPEAEAARRILGRHLLEPVNFVAEIEAMYAAGCRTFVEVGPRAVLTGLVRAILAGKSHQAIALDASGGRENGLADLARTLCRLAALGFPVHLDQWEEAPPAAPRAPRMQVMLSGANYRAARTRAPAAVPPPAPPERTVERADALPDSSGRRPQPPQDFLTEGRMKKDPPLELNAALQSVKEGVHAIQAIQLQTAEAHRKFLETQSEASRILLELVRGAGLAAAAVAEQAAAQTPPALPRTEALAPPPPAAPASVPAAAPPPPPAAEIPAAAAPAADAPSPIEKVLLAVVSELTGYPAAMLGLDLDIEADLGIDSIKRVEILSALEERLPGLPPVAPEEMGRLKTLGQIAARLEGARPPETGPARTPAPPEAASPSACQPDVVSTLLAVVSELTGYPAAMLGLDLDIEADLGIDSIKRVEILSALEERLPGLPPVAPEEMGRLKTLGQIAARLDLTPQGLSAAPSPAAPPPPAEACRDGAPAAPPAPVLRRTVEPVDAPAPAETPIRIPKGRKVFVTDDRTGLAPAIVDALSAMGISTVLISIDILKFKKDLPHAGGLIIVHNPGAADPDAEIRHAFELTHVLARDLLESARLEGAFFATVTRLDGAFGFGGRPLARPEQGALAGLAKTAALEWPDVRCHALDLSPEWLDHRAAAAAVLREVMARGPVEVGLAEGRRRTLALLPAPDLPGGMPLAADDVLVASGGARGITADCLIEIARRIRPTLVLFGRSPDPVAEPGYLAGITEEAELKQALLAHEFNGRGARPAEIERRLGALRANREIAATLKALAASGVRAEYRRVDVRDAEAVGRAIEAVRARFGPIRGLVHGAGVIADRLIAEKTIEQFDRVFATKVAGFRALVRAARPDELRVIVLFSSITARLGNKGQADYAMANEALNKMAQAEARRRPACRVVAVNWGPWAAGMVGPALRREFARQGVPLLDSPSGAAALLHAIAQAPGGPVEVVVGGSPDPETTAPAARPRASELSLLFEREIDLEECPVLASHVIDGHAVVPMALMSEWFGHGALHENPGLVLHGLDELRVLNGIRMTERTKLIRLMAGKMRRREGRYEIDLELRNGLREGRDLIHSRARAILVDDLSPPPAYSLPPALAVRDYSRSVEEIYARILFHGRDLHGLRRVLCCNPCGMVAEAAGAPSPEAWLKSPLRNGWLGDPLALDTAFQMASLWCYEQHGTVSLPSHAQAYRQYRAAFPADGVTIVLEVREATARKLRGDLFFLDADGVLVARLTGLEAVMDPLLNRAFKPEGAGAASGPA
jgi:acyl transferase domain-containing protein/NADP-dependent 3-hydroxy acid dehydrogenase YdfG